MATTVTVLGSTGSIGISTLDVVRRHADDYDVHALTANTAVDKLLEQCLEFAPRYAVMCDEDRACELRERLEREDSVTEVLGGHDNLVRVAGDTAGEVVMAAIVGGAGLAPTFAAASKGKRVLLANKEALVMGGAIFMRAVTDNDATLLPIDSEHNAIFQCLANGALDHARGVAKIWLTASGGPLLRDPLDTLHAVTPERACAHPNWDMGRKISVDSATMMNKGLELIEACWLFGVAPDLVEIVIHPQSIVHSMVEYVDGSVVAQLGNPDMRTPIAHGLGWPGRLASGVRPLDLLEVKGLDFEPVDHERFPCLALARDVADAKQSFSIALNAANEVAVQAFLDELILFTEIPLIIEGVLARTDSADVDTLEDVIAFDGEAREKARETTKRFIRSVEI